MLHMWAMCVWTNVLKPHLWLFAGAGALLLFTGFWLVTPQPVEAQCGSSASSCKTCHETQGQDSVNAKGDWHIQHAFGDFCESCHAGNVQATDKAGAHQGLVDPLSDVAASCQTCHPQDTTAKAQQYASTLGITLVSNPVAGGGKSSGSSNTGASAAGAGTTGAAAANNSPAQASGGSPLSAAPLGGEQIDFNTLYAEKMAPPSWVNNWGNVILLALLVMLAGTFLTAWAWEGWGPVVARWLFSDTYKIVHYEPDTVPTSPELEALFRRKPELKELWPILANSDTALLQDVLRILGQEDQGANILHAVSRLDLKLAAALRQLNEQDRELLLAVVKEM